MFEHTESWEFSDPTAEHVARESEAYWERAGFQVEMRGPTWFHARSWSSVFGIVRTLEVEATPEANGCRLRLRFFVGMQESGEPTRRVLFRAPAPRAGWHGKTPWEICEEDWERDRTTFWNYLLHVVGAKPSGLGADYCAIRGSPHVRTSSAPAATPAPVGTLSPS